MCLVSPKFDVKFQILHTFAHLSLKLLRDGDTKMLSTRIKHFGQTGIQVLAVFHTSVGLHCTICFYKSSAFRPQWV
jgi:hypothetical protein